MQAFDLDVRISMLDYSLSRIKDDQKFLIELKKELDVSKSSHTP